MKPFVRPLMLVVIGALCAWALVRWVYTPYRCQREIAEIGNSTKLADQMASESRAAPLAQQNLRRARELEKSCRTCVTLYPVIAANEQILGRDDDAIETYRRALTIARRPELHFAIGMILMRQGRVDDAVAEFTHLAQFSPGMLKAIDAPYLECHVHAQLARQRVSGK